jgi:hypothetical protein
MELGYLRQEERGCYIQSLDRIQGQIFFKNGSYQVRNQT